MYAGRKLIRLILASSLLSIFALLLACAPAQIVRETVVVVVTPTDAAAATSAPTDVTTSESPVPATIDLPTLQFATATTAPTIIPPISTRPIPATPTITPPVVKIALFEGGTSVIQTAPETTNRAVTTALVFEADVSLDTSKVKDTLSHVDMRLIDAQNQSIYQHTENSEPYCMFGDANKKCNSWVFANHGSAWPNNRPVQRGSYFLRALAITAAGRTRGAEAAIYIDPRPNGGDSPIQVQIVQTGPGNNDEQVGKALVLQAEAFDQRVGGTDGQGIDHVDFTIVDQLGNVAYQHTEKTAKYCAFGGGEPDCNIWNFAAHDNRWPTGIPINNNTQYFLRAVAYATDGTNGPAVASVIVRH